MIPRISMGNVNHRLLTTRIHKLSLDPDQQYNSRDAIWAIEEAKEVQARMRELGLSRPPVVFSGPMAVPAPELPHLPELITDATMDEALDRVAQTFGGLVTYGECVSSKGEHLVFVDFVYIQQDSAQKAKGGSLGLP